MHLTKNSCAIFAGDPFCSSEFRETNNEFSEQEALEEPATRHKPAIFFWLAQPSTNYTYSEIQLVLWFNRYSPTTVFLLPINLRIVNHFPPKKIHPDLPILSLSKGVSSKCRDSTTKN